MLMGQCSHCGKPTSWLRRVKGSLSTGGLGGNSDGMQAEFCDRACLDAFAEKKRREEEDARRKPRSQANKLHRSSSKLRDEWMRAKERLKKLEHTDRCISCGKEDFVLLGQAKTCIECTTRYSWAKEQDRTIRPGEKGYCYRCGFKFKGSVTPQTIDGELYCGKCGIWHREVELPRREARREVQEREKEWERAEKEERRRESRRLQAELRKKERQESKKIKAAVDEVQAIRNQWAEANAGNPRDAAHYFQLGRVLLGSADGRWSESATTWVTHLSGKEALGGEKGKPYANPRASAHAVPMLAEATVNYLKAISLGMPNPYDSGCAKLTYAKLLCLLARDGSEHYARDAEKDFRMHLRSTPDHVPTLERMTEAVWIYEVNDETRSQRVESLRARIQEAKTRVVLGVTGRAQAPPGGVESSYPENWSTLAESVRKRDGYRCTQCRAQNVELHVHHIVPLSKGGDNDVDNLTTLCDYCHGEIHPRMGR